MSTENLSPVWSRIFNLTIDRGEGIYIYTPDGREYMDFTSGIGVVNTGHCHPAVVSAARDQVGRLIHAQVNIHYHTPMLRLTEALLEVMPALSLDTFFFSNSGAEAIEAAIKLARHATGKTNIIVFQGSFHGRTNQTMAMTTGSTIYRAGYAPLASGIFVAPYPYAYRYGWDEETTSQWCLKELRHLLASQTAPHETAAIVIEPVLGEGGYVVPPASFLPGVRQICDEHGLLLIADEIQSGFGRTGKFFALEHFNCQPDILVMAKGLASGFPLSAIASRRQLMEKWIPGSHGGTYGGNAVACAAAEATVRILQDGLVENAARMGEVLKSGLETLKPRHPLIGDVRGLGLMIATELTTPQGRPAGDFAKAVKAACERKGLLLLLCGTYHNVFRWIPPLVVTAGEIERALSIFDQAMTEVQETT